MRKALATALAVAVIGALAPAAAAAPQGATTTSVAGRALPESVRALVAHRPTLTAAAQPSINRAAVVLGPGTLSLADPVNDVAPPYRDISNLSVRSTPSLTRFGADTAWRWFPQPDEAIVWWLDRDGDGNAERAVFSSILDGKRIAGLSTVAANPRWLCDGSTTPDANSVSIPTGCLGAIPNLRISAATYGPGSDAAVDTAPASGTVGPVGPAPGVPSPSGGVVMTTGGFFQMFFVGTAPSSPVIGDQFARLLRHIPRAFTIGPDGSNGYAIDGFGNVAPLGLGEDFGGSDPISGPAFGFDIARGIAVAPDGRRGWVLDGFGGIHHFSIGMNRVAPPLFRVAYWHGWDIARGIVVLPDGTGGWVLDGFGGLHFFSIGRARSAPRVLGAPYWSGWDIARSVSLLPDGSGGFVVDAYGGAHFFSIGKRRTAPPISLLHYAPGNPYLAGIAVLRDRPPLPDSAPPPGVALPGARTVEFGVDGKLYVAADDLAVVDVATEQVVDHIAVGNDPGGISISPDQTRLAVVSFGAGELVIVDLTNRTELKRITLPPYLSGTVAYGDDGTVFVGGVLGSMYRVDVDTGTVSEIPVYAGGPVVLDGSGDGTKVVTVGNVGVNTVVRVFSVATSTFTATKTYPGADGFEVGVDYAANRIVIGPKGAVFDGALNQLVAPLVVDTSMVTDVDLFGASWYSAVGQTVVVHPLQPAGPTTTLHLYGTVESGESFAPGNLAVSADLTTIAVVTSDGVELIHR